MSMTNTIKSVFKFRKIKAADRNDLLQEGVSPDQIEEIKTGEGEAAIVTHVRRKALEIAYKVPTVEGMLEEGAKGAETLQTLINNAANGIVRKLVDSGEAIAEDFAVTFTDIVDALTPTRKASKTQRVTNAQLGDVLKLFADWALDAGKSEKAVTFFITYMKQRFNPAVMSALKPELIEKTTEVVALFADEMTDAQVSEYSHVLEMLTENLLEAINYEPEEVDLSDL